MMKECLLTYVSSGCVVTARRKAALRGCNLLLSAIQKKSGKPSLTVHSAKEDVSPDLNGLYKNNGFLVMLESKEFEALNIVFPFVGALVDRATSKQRDYP